MRTIKFRGRHVEYHDEIYYGFYVMDARGNHFIIDSNNIMHIVDPESVAQLVGHDKHGKEVYEDDILLDDDEFSNEWQAHLTWQVTDKDCADIECFYNLDELTLKEAHHE